jgi:hypothetical protein
MRLMGARRTTLVLPVTLVCVLCALLGHATSASAASGDLTYTPLNPIAGQSVTFTDNFCAGRSSGPDYRFTVDGTPQPAGGNTLTTTFTAGSHTVSVVDNVPACSSINNTDSVTFTVGRALSGTIAVSPDPPVAGQRATLSVTPDGGKPGYTYAWDSDNDGTFDNGTTFEIPATFPTAGPRDVKVRVTDSQSNTTVVTRSITVADPPPAGSPPPPPPPPAPPCKKMLAFAVSAFTTTGCFVQDGTSGRWTTRSSIKLNGILFEGNGQTFTVTEPGATPGGHFSAPNSSIQLGTLTAYSGDIDWDLPAGREGDEALFRTVPVLLGTQLFGLNVRGEIGLRLGFRNGAHYADFPLKIELPGSFRPGPDPSLGRATGSASLRVDEGGIRFNGLKLEADEVWAGKLKLNKVCFSYVPAGGQSVEPCEAPNKDGQPFLRCNSNVDTDRWDGSALIELPSTSIQLGAFGGLADGKVSKLGGFVDNLGRRAPITPNVYLKSVGVGLCLTPPPFKLRGTVGVSIIPLPPVNGEARNTADIDGGFLYTDPYGFEPWSLKLDGTVKVFGTQVGSGYVTYRPTGAIDFGLAAGFDVSGVASLNGQIDGWVDGRRFSLTGSAKGCVGGVLCATGSGTISSVGVAGCFSAESTYTDYGTLLVSFSPFRVRFAESKISIKAGFGYTWSTANVDLFGSSCNFAPYQPTRATARAASAPGSFAQVVAKGTPAVSLRVHGSKGPPKVVITGPGGRTITSPTNGKGKQVEGRFLLAENSTDATTNVLLLKPAPGTWTVRPAAGATSVPTSVDRAKLEAPPVFGATVRRAGAARVLQVAYAVPRGTVVQLRERAKGVVRTLATRLQGRRCPSGPRTRPGSDQLLLCATVRFRPGRGPGGTRRIEATVTRGGRPVVQKPIASYTAPRETLPARPAPLRIRRSRGSLVVQFAPVTGASRYTAAVALSDGRELGLDVAGSCRAVRFADVPTTSAATVRVAGVRYDLAVGPRRAITLKAGALAAGKPTRPRSQWRPKEPCT